MTKQETIALQLKLAAAGLYNPQKIDGIYGDKTKLAYAKYLDNLGVESDIPLVPPPADAPWWRTRRAIGLIIVIIGFTAQVGGYNIDTAATTELVVKGLELGGEVMAYGGILLSLFGAWRAKSKIDATLVARVGDTDIRLPHRMYNDPVPPHDPFGHFRSD